MGQEARANSREAMATSERDKVGKTCSLSRLTKERAPAEAASWVPCVCSNGRTTEALGYEPSKIKNIGLGQIGWGCGVVEGEGEGQLT